VHIVYDYPILNFELLNKATRLYISASPLDDWNWRWQLIQSVIVVRGDDMHERDPCDFLGGPMDMLSAAVYASPYLAGS
jgi:hypothetical protein